MKDSACSSFELHRLLSMVDASHAADLLDNASRGALTAVRFLERAPLGQAEADDSAQADEAATDDRDGDQADDHAQAQAGYHDQARADDHAQADDQDSDGVQAPCEQAD